jgi:hypothetical protein
VWSTLNHYEASAEAVNKSLQRKGKSSVKDGLFNQLNHLEAKIQSQEKHTLLSYLHTL